MVVLPVCVSEMCGKKFREKLRKPSPIGKTAKNSRLRMVPAFTVQALQKNTCVFPPPLTGVFHPAPHKPTQFRIAYHRMELPMSIEFSNKGKTIDWKIPVENLDFSYYLPIFITGLAEGTIPYDYMVELGLLDMFTKGGHKVLACLPLIIVPLQGVLWKKSPYSDKTFFSQLLLVFMLYVHNAIMNIISEGYWTMVGEVAVGADPGALAISGVAGMMLLLLISFGKSGFLITEALHTKIPAVIINTMKCLGRMVKLCPGVGYALVAYFRQLLPPLNLMLLRNRKFEAGETVHHETDAIFMIEETLRQLECCGGPDAFINIKYYIPHYESVVKN